MNISFYIMYIVVEKYFPCRVLNFIRHTIRDIYPLHIRLTIFGWKEIHKSMLHNAATMTHTQCNHSQRCRRVQASISERKRVRYYVLDILNKSLSGAVFNLNESGIQNRVICTLRHNITMVLDLGFHNCALVRYNLKRIPVYQISNFIPQRLKKKT